MTNFHGDNYAVGVCAKLQHDLIFILYVRATYIFQRLDYELISTLWNGSLAHSTLQLCMSWFDKNIWYDVSDSKVHGANMGPTGPRWSPCWPHELCYLGYTSQYHKNESSPHIDGLVQERRNCSVLAMELHLSYTNPYPWVGARKT